jgi:hypothetical protein
MFNFSQSLLFVTCIVKRRDDLELHIFHIRDAEGGTYCNVLLLTVRNSVSPASFFCM